MSWYVDDNNNMLLCLSDEIPIIKSVYRQQCELPFEYHVHSDVPILTIHSAALRIYKNNNNNTT